MVISEEVSFGHRDVLEVALTTRLVLNLLLLQAEAGFSSARLQDSAEVGLVEAEG